MGENMKNMIIALIATLGLTLLFSLTGKSLIIMYIILLTETYFTFTEYKNVKKQKQIPEQNNYIKKQYSVKIKPPKIVNSKVNSKQKVKVKTLNHKR